MNKKKILLTAILLIIAFAFPAHASDESASDFLIGFGVLNAKDKAEDDALITRGEFAKLAAEIAVSYDFDYSKEEPKFADVQKDSKYYNSVMLLSDLGVINGVSAVEFAPDKNIGTNDACAVMVRILGYDFLAEQKGYTALASEIGLLKGVKLSEGDLTSENAYKIIRNALFCEVKYSNRIDGYKTEFHGAPLMEKRLGITEITGIVSDNGKTGLSQDTVVGEGNVMIGTSVYTDKSNSGDLLGCRVKAYLKETDDEDVIIYMYAPSSKNEIAVLGSDDIIGYSNRTYEVSKENSSKTERYPLTSDYKLIYNGKPLLGGVDPDLLDDLMTPSNGSVKLIDNNSDGKFECAIIENYYTIVVKGYQDTSKTLFNALDVSAPENLLDPVPEISLEDVKDVEVVNASGTKMSLESIAKNNVVSVMVSADKTYAKVVISVKNVSGSFTASQEDNRYITVNGEIYETASDIREYMTFPQVGENITLYLRHDGKVAFVENGLQSNGIFAYFHKVIYDEDIEKTRINIFTEKKEVKNVVLSDKVIIDGERYKDQKEAMNYLVSNPYALQGLIIVNFNEAEEVTKIDTPYYKQGETGPTAPGVGEGDINIHVMKDKYQVSGSALSWISSDGFVDENTRIFVIPCDTGESMASMANVSVKNIDINEVNVTNSWNEAVLDSTVVHTRYLVDDDSLYTDAIIVYKNTTGKDMDNTSDATRASNVVVTKISQAVNTDDELCYEIWYTTGSAPARVYTQTLNGLKCMKSGNTVQVGDIIKFGKNKNGLIPDKNLVIMYSPKTDPDNLLYENGNFSKLDYNSSGVGNWDLVLLKGKVDVMNDRFIRIIRDKYTNGVASKESILLQRAKMQYIVYEDGKVDFADGSYIETRKEMGDNARDVIFNWTEGSIGYAYIVR